MPLDAGTPDSDLPRRLRICRAATKVLDTPGDPLPAPFEKVDTVEGVRLALNGEGQVLAVMEDVAPEVKRFALRRFVLKTFGVGNRAVEWTYVELADGLRIYMSASGVVISRTDINPSVELPDATDPG